MKNLTNSLKKKLVSKYTVSDSPKSHSKCTDINVLFLSSLTLLSKIFTLVVLILSTSISLVEEMSEFNIFVS